MLALVDADIVLHRVGFTTNDDEEWIARARTNEMLEGILHDTGATSCELWLSDSRENNFRTHLWGGYKANRINTPRPIHYDYIKELLINEWGARIAHGQEADDALGIGQDQTTYPAYDDKQDDTVGFRTVICSIDKDLKQVSGLHYDFVKKVWEEIDPEEAQLRFYTQLLTGDLTDNIRGCYGIGPVKANKLFKELGPRPTAYQMFGKVLETYLRLDHERSTEEIKDHLLLIGRLLKIRTEEDEKLWDFPQ